MLMIIILINMTLCTPIGWKTGSVTSQLSLISKNEQQNKGNTLVILVNGV